MKMEWFWLAFLSLFMFAGMTLIQKYLLNLGMHPIIFGLYLEGFAFIGLFIAALATNQRLTIPSLWVVFLIFAAIFSIIAIISSTFSFKLSPNPGYTQAIISASAVVILIASVFLFKSELTIIKTVGIILTVIGVILLGLK